MTMDNLVVNSDSVDVIDKINDRIAQKVGRQKYKIWFKNSTRISLENDYLKVGVPNLFIGGWVENHFAQEISAAAQEQTGRSVKVAFTIDPDLFGNQQQRQLNRQAEAVAQSTNPVVTQRRRRKPVNEGADPRMKLDQFVVGSSNQLAYSAACSVAAQPGRQFNPLFIHGGCGLGKTHLLQGICNAIRKDNPDVNTMYLSGEEFTNRYIMSLKMGKLDLFRHRFRQMDLLLIDDIHFLASKKATQEEFLHTFNAIDAANRQVVLASDVHPRMIGQLSESLVSRFVSGMVVKVESPDFVTRCKILRQRATMMEKLVPQPVLEYIAERIQGNVRELEGALLKVIAYADLDHGIIDLQRATVALEDHIVRTSPIIHLSDIESVVAAFFGVTPADIHSSRKTRIVSLARSVALYLARKHTTMSFPEIGRFMGNKNHATVIQACKKIKKFIQSDQVVTWESATGKRQMGIVKLITRLESSFTRKSP